MIASRCKQSPGAELEKDVKAFIMLSSFEVVFSARDECGEGIELVENIIHLI